MRRVQEAVVAAAAVIVTWLYMYYSFLSKYYICIVHSCVIIETTREAWPLPCGLASSLGSVRHASLVSIIHAFPTILVYRHSHFSSFTET